MKLFTSTLHDLSVSAIPKTSSVAKKLHKPWWNDECQEACTNRKKALKLFKRQPSSENLNKFKYLYAKARRIIRENMRKSWRDYVSKLNHKTPTNKVWDMVSKITGKKVFPSIKQLKKDGNNITEVNEIANVLANNIVKNSSTENYSEKFKRHKIKAEHTALNFNTNNMEDYNAPFKMGELVDSLKKSHDTAVGPDDIHYQILKHLPECTLDTLLNIYNQIWDGGDFTTEWREATIIPIPKPGKDTTNPNNYRPIALTSCICKTFERMVNSRLVWYSEKHSIITAYQSGFRKSRSTIDQIIRLESAVREAFVKREHLVSVYFDLEKAYDTTWRYGVMKDLHEAGLRGKMPIFIANFLINRKFSVRIGGTLSEIYDQEEGVPQGSILAVTLFSIKINSIMKCLGNGIDGSLYVDDFLICYQSKQMNTIERHLQLCLNKIQKWADENGFKFSQSKTVSMHFCNLRKLHHEPTLTLNGLAIPVVQEHKFLGVIFDNKLSFIPHIKYLKARCLKALNLLKVVSRFDWGADSIVLLRLYRALVRSKLDYGSIVYGSAISGFLLGHLEHRPWKIFMLKQMRSHCTDAENDCHCNMQ